MMTMFLYSRILRLQLLWDPEGQVDLAVPELVLVWELVLA
jgi:hypothetical protein